MLHDYLHCLVFKEQSSWRGCALATRIILHALFSPVNTFLQKNAKKFPQAAVSGLREAFNPR
jgi:hypothetical protein